MRAEGPTPRNLLLESIANDCGLQRAIEPVQFPAGHQIAAPGQPLRHFYFPLSGVLSTMTHLREGKTAETQTIGNEGMVGIQVWLGVASSLESVLQQAPGRVLRIPARLFCKQIIGHRHTERLLKRFTAYSLRFGSQVGVCNSHHPVRQRTCRWLLTMADRAHSAQLQLTHSLLAHMLGVRRQSITEVARALSDAGAIRYGRGTIQILDRAALQEASCECYSDMNRLYDTLVRAAL